MAGVLQPAEHRGEVFRLRLRKEASDNPIATTADGRDFSSVEWHTARTTVEDVQRAVATSDPELLRNGAPWEGVQFLHGADADGPDSRDCDDADDDCADSVDKKLPRLNFLPRFAAADEHALWLQTSMLPPPPPGFHDALCRNNRLRAPVPVDEADAAGRGPLLEVRYVHVDFDSFDCKGDLVSALAVVLMWQGYLACWHDYHGEGAAVSVPSNAEKLAALEQEYSRVLRKYGPLRIWNVSKVPNGDLSDLLGDCMEKIVGGTEFSARFDFSDGEIFSLRLGNSLRRYSTFDVSGWNVSGITNMRRMFAGWRKFDCDLSCWDVSAVTDMSEMFLYCERFNCDLSGWKVSNVTTTEHMFHGCRSFNQPLEKWDVSGVTNMSEMFAGCRSFNQPVGPWDVSGVTNMSGMFRGCVGFNQKLDRWNVSKVAYFQGTFQKCSSFDQPLQSWVVTGAESFQFMFADCIAFNQPVGGWDVSRAWGFGGMFRNCCRFNQPLAAWKVSKGWFFEEMLAGCREFNQSLREWNLSRAREIRGIIMDTPSLDFPFLRTHLPTRPRGCEQITMEVYGRY